VSGGGSVEPNRGPQQRQLKTLGQGMSPTGDLRREKNTELEGDSTRRRDEPLPFTSHRIKHRDHAAVNAGGRQQRGLQQRDHNNSRAGKQDRSEQDLSKAIVPPRGRQPKGRSEYGIAKKKKKKTPPGRGGGPGLMQAEPDSKAAASTSVRHDDASNNEVELSGFNPSASVKANGSWRFRQTNSH